VVSGIYDTSLAWSLPSLLPRIGIVVAVVCVGGCGRMRYFT